jgi:hypothetical protein
MRTASDVLIVVGVAIVAVGLALRFAPWLVSWFGNLPGDIRLQRDSTRIQIPLVSMIIVSVIVTLLANLVMRGR